MSVLLLCKVSIPLLRRLLVSFCAWGASPWAGYWERRHVHGQRVSESNLLQGWVLGRQNRQLGGNRSSCHHFQRRPRPPLCPIMSHRSSLQARRSGGASLWGVCSVNHFLQQHHHRPGHGVVLGEALSGKGGGGVAFSAALRMPQAPTLCSFALLFPPDVTWE